MATVPNPVVTEKDIVLAVLGVASGLAGLVLVFFGLMITRYQSLEAPTSAKVLAPYRRSVAFVLAAFAVGVGTVSVATLWLVQRGANESLYKATLVLFGAQLVAVVVATTITARRLMWKR